MEQGFEKVELIGENGEREEFVVDYLFEHDGREYIVFSKEDADESLMMRVEYDDSKNAQFVQIEEDAEFEAALKALDEILMEQ